MAEQKGNGYSESDLIKASRVLAESMTLMADGLRSIARVEKRIEVKGVVVGAAILGVSIVVAACILAGFIP